MKNTFYKSLSFAVFLHIGIFLYFFTLSPNPSPVNGRGEQTSAPHSANGKREQSLSPLVNNLEQAIEQHKYYPLSALQQHQQGNVNIAFVLHPNGTLTNIHIVNSSHYVELDSAAVNAVTAASPVYSIAQYVKNDMPVQLRLQYKLNP